MWSDYELSTKPYLKPAKEPLCEAARQAVVMHLIDKKRALESQIFEIDNKIEEINNLGSVNIEI